MPQPGELCGAGRAAGTRLPLQNPGLRLVKEPPDKNQHSCGLHADLLAENEVACPHSCCIGLASTQRLRLSPKPTRLSGPDGQVMMDSKMDLDDLLAEPGGICVIANTLCCVHIDSSGEVETDRRSSPGQVVISCAPAEFGAPG